VVHEPSARILTVEASFGCTIPAGARSARYAVIVGHVPFALSSLRGSVLLFGAWVARGSVRGARAASVVPPPRRSLQGDFEVRGSTIGGAIEVGGPPYSRSTSMARRLEARQARSAGAERPGFRES